MPHFTIEHSLADRLGLSEVDLVRTVFDAAQNSGLFGTEDIKVRALPCVAHQNGTDNYAFIHVAVRIMPGRTEAQKSGLAHTVADGLKALGQHGRVDHCRGERHQPRFLRQTRQLGLSCRQFGSIRAAKHP